MANFPLKHVKNVWNADWHASAWYRWRVEWEKKTHTHKITAKVLEKLSRIVVTERNSAQYKTENRKIISVKMS